LRGDFGKLIYQMFIIKDGIVFRTQVINYLGKAEWKPNRKRPTSSDVRSIVAVVPSAKHEGARQ
jgi:hypothetical protein